jgi:hypothetical protein
MGNNQNHVALATKEVYLTRLDERSLAHERQQGQDRVQRCELFALGCILAVLDAGQQLG